jgi:hypothetical protein
LFTQLSTSARQAADAVEAARKETRERVIARRDQARASATAAMERVTQDLQTVGRKTDANWNAFQAKIQSDVARLRSKAQEKKAEISANLAAQRAQDLEVEASVAIDYAIASIEDAKQAVLDALVANFDAVGKNRDVSDSV